MQKINTNMLRRLVLCAQNLYKYATYVFNKFAQNTFFEMMLNILLNPAAEKRQNELILAWICFFWPSMKNATFQKVLDNQSSSLSLVFLFRCCHGVDVSPVVI